MRVLKFGGSSVRDAERIRTVTEVVREAERRSPVVVVVSALGGITDGLLRAGEAARRGEDTGALQTEIKHRHSAAAAAVASPDELPLVQRRLGEALEELRDLLRGVALLGELSPRALDRIASFGERLSAMLVAAALRRGGREAEDCDARGLVVTDHTFGNARFDPRATYPRIREHMARARALQVITGFIAATPEGETTTLGRGGSDLTASIVGAALDAEAVEIWTDVDGVMSCDPRQVPDAFSLPHLSFDELMELSHFGAKVVYPPTVRPARERGIPLLIKNTLNPAFPGTLIDENAPANPHPITGIASIHHVSLLRLEGEGMVGVPGYARRLFDALANAQVSVVLISQASSEHSICFALDPKTVPRAQAAVDREFAVERKTGELQPLVVEDPQCVVAVVGAGMRHRPGIAGRLFSQLGRHQLNVRAIAQGSSEINISLVLDQADEQRALRVIHDAFFSPADEVLSLVVCGVGRVGTALLDQLQAQAELLRARGVDLRLRGLVSSRAALFDRPGAPLPASAGAGWRELLSARGEPQDTAALVERVAALPGRCALVDCTASPELGALYPELLARGVAVVSANKLPFAGPLALDPRQLRSGGLFYEATAGAGLPVVRALQDLLLTGDRLVRLEGLFSGTLGFLCGALRAGRPLSEALAEAERRGYTEPDPRQDLSGRDVVRKLLVLAREAGWELEQRDVALEPFCPAELLALPGPAVRAALAEHDQRLLARFAAAAARGGALVYLAELSSDGASVGLREVAADHPAARAHGSDNLFALTTRYYHERPLVIAGPGAGPEVTASGLFADILRACAGGVGGFAPVR